MKVCFVTEKSLNRYWQEDFGREVPDVLLFGFTGLGLVSYKRELSGETEYFRDVAGLSREIGGVIVSGCDTDTYGVYRHSAVVADQGRILGVSDATFSMDDSVFVAGGNLRVYDTSKGRIGVLVGEDLFYPEAAHTLALCDSELIVSVLKSRERMSEVMMRAAAFAEGVPVAQVAHKYAEIADIRGEIAFAGSFPVASAQLKLQKDYHLVGCRRRGRYKER